MKKIKAIFCDLDGTLLANDTKSCHPLFIRYLEQMQKANISFILCTGRLFEETLTVFEELNQNFQAIPYLICANGAQIYDTKAKKLIVNSEFSAEASKYMYELLLKAIKKNPCMQALIYKSKNEILFWPNTELIINKLDDKKSSDLLLSNVKDDVFLNIEDKEGFFDHMILKNAVPHRQIEVDQLKLKDFDNLTKVVVLDLKSEKLPLKDFFKINLKQNPEFDIALSAGYSIEIYQAQHNKGSAVKYVAGLLGVSNDQVLVCGDAGNDISMLSQFKNSACPDWASKDVLNASSYHFEGAPSEWVLKIFDKYVLK